MPKRTNPKDAEKLLLIIATLFLLISFGCSKSDKAKENAPGQQVEFEKARNEYWDQYFASSNEIKASDVFNKSREHTCSFASKYGREFSNWTGTVAKMRTDQGGDKVSIFEITSASQGVTITYRQMDIKRGTPLFSILTQLSPGDKVIFDFSFEDEPLSHNVKECFDETSLTERGSLKEPEFRVAFRNIRKL